MEAYAKLNPEDSATVQKRVTKLKQASPIIDRVVNAALLAPTGMEGALRAQAGRIPGVEGGQAEYLQRDIRGFAKAIADVFASEVGVATDRDIDRWLDIMPRPGDTKNERIRQASTMVQQIKAEASLHGLDLDTSELENKLLQYAQ